MSNAFAFLGTHGESTDRPQGPDDAKLLPDWPEWKGALQGERSSITSKGTYTLVDRPPGVNVIGTRWVLSKKFDADGRLVQHKARLCSGSGLLSAVWHRFPPELVAGRQRGQSSFAAGDLGQQGLCR